MQVVERSEDLEGNKGNLVLVDKITAGDVAQAGAVVAKDYVKIEVVVAVDVLSVAVYQIDNVFVAEAGECEEF